MKLNIFKISTGEVDLLRAKLVSANMQVIKETDQSGWHGEFYFSDKPHPSPIPWVKTYHAYFPEGADPKNFNHFAVYLFVKEGSAFALSYGKAHFYIRPFCDYDFGIELAKRIADDEDIRQTSGKRFAGKRTKDIKSFSSNSPLIIESGESIDYIQASVIKAKQETFGKTGKFGTSAQITPKVDPPDLGQFLNKLEAELAEAPRFPLPRTLVVIEPAEVERFDELLLDELTAPVGTSDFTNNTFDLYGVDFVFPSEGAFTLKCGRSNKQQLEQLTMADFKQYIEDHKIPRDDILKIKITHEPEDSNSYTNSIKECVDFLADSDRVVLSGGKWMHFNQDYLDFLDDAIREIEVEEIEEEFKVITLTEPTFNISAEVTAAGFEVADKNFEIFTTRRSTPVEAWDLRRDTTVYAVKFGDAQKLNYVCAQALNVLELLRNKSETKEVPNFDRYCLWFGYRVKNLPDSMADSGSIILKQQIEAWARRATELGITPVIRMSQKIVLGIDNNDAEEAASDA
ncbi:DUF6119 family protein [Marmoricola sp. RAF53]|uniref:DUF6119 family protein n=1 Tax=Marmoricola sp. RAF53 TaxID=3233059 RepID=UPI003F97E4C8